MSWFT